MAQIPIQDTAFTGFSIVWRRPGAVAIWALLQMIAAVILNVLLISMAGPALTQLAAYGLSPTTGSARAMMIVTQLGQVYLLVAPFALVLNSVLYGAMNRAVLSPAESEFGYLRLGPDEARQLGLQLIAGLVFMVIYIVLACFVGLAVLAASGGAKPILGLFLPGACGAVAVGVFIYLMVRLSLASALTFDTGRINLFGSWNLTRGRFWPILGVYALALVLVVIVLFLSTLIIIALGSLVNGGSNPMGWLVSPEAASLPAFFSPPRLVQTLLGSVAAALYLPLILTPPAAIYRQVAPRLRHGDVPIDTVA